jgi:hypothetical protein
LAKELADLFRIAREDDRVSADDHARNHTQQEGQRRPAS